MGAVVEKKRAVTRRKPSTPRARAPKPVPIAPAKPKLVRPEWDHERPPQIGDPLPHQEDFKIIGYGRLGHGERLSRVMTPCTDPAVCPLDLNDKHRSEEHRHAELEKTEGERGFGWIGESRSGPVVHAVLIDYHHPGHHVQCHICRGIYRHLGGCTGGV